MDIWNVVTTFFLQSYFLPSKYQVNKISDIYLPLQENQLTEADNLSVLPDPGYYKQLLKQIEILGWERYNFVQFLR